MQEPELIAVSEGCTRGRSGPGVFNTCSGELLRGILLNEHFEMDTGDLPTFLEAR